MGVFADAGAWPGVLAELSAGRDLSADVARSAMECILEGEATPAQIAAFIVALRVKGESPAEVAGLVDAMLEAAAPLDLADPERTVDLVGTGGATPLRGRAFNVSTMASLVAAASGATVCKHGNRKASSTSGSTDLLEALGVEVELDGPRVARCVDEAGVGFAFARMFHPAMRHAAPVRAELGMPTVFNVLGPLSHPGRVGRQVLGVSDPRLLRSGSGGAACVGASTRAWVVHGSDGLDELTTTDATTVVEVRDGEIRRFEVRPEDVGLATSHPGRHRGRETPRRTQSRPPRCSKADPGRCVTWWCSTRLRRWWWPMWSTTSVPAWSAPARRSTRATRRRTLGEFVAVSRALLSTDED